MRLRLILSTLCPLGLLLAPAAHADEEEDAVEFKASLQHSDLTNLGIIGSIAVPPGTALKMGVAIEIATPDDLFIKLLDKAEDYDKLVEQKTKEFDGAKPVDLETLGLSKGKLKKAKINGVTVLEYKTGSLRSLTFVMNIGRKKDAYICMDGGTYLASQPEVMNMIAMCKSLSVGKVLKSKKKRKKKKKKKKKGAETETPSAFSTVDMPELKVTPPAGFEGEYSYASGAWEFTKGSEWFRVDVLPPNAPRDGKRFAVRLTDDAEFRQQGAGIARVGSKRFKPARWVIEGAVADVSDGSPSFAFIMVRHLKQLRVLDESSIDARVRSLRLRCTGQFLGQEGVKAGLKACDNAAF